MPATKKEILELVSIYIKEKHAKKTWTPGKDWVQYAGPHFDDNEYISAISTLLDEWLVLGNDAIQFEKQFPKLVNRQHGIVTNSGSSSNLLMVATLKSKKLWGYKNEYIVTPVAGFPTTLNPILQLGFKPAFVDIELDTLNINPEHAEQIAYNTNAIAIMFAHVLGNPPNMHKIMQLVNEKNIILLEDCCDALGSQFQNIPLGSFGQMASFSFYPAHHITMGEGGFITCQNKEIETVVRSLREWGRGCFCVGKAANLSTKGMCGTRYNNWIPAFPDEIFDHKYVYEEIGYNLKPLELQCSIGLSQLKKLPIIINRRKANYTALLKIFQPYEEYFILPKAREHADVSWFAFPLTIRNGAPFKRYEFCQFLEGEKIQTRNYFGGNLLLQPAYSELVTSYGDYEKIKKTFPNATKATTDTFFLGTSPVIDTPQLEYIQEVINNFFTK